MLTKIRKTTICSVVFITAFVIWTFLVQIFDVKPIGVNETEVGFSLINGWFHSLSGVNFVLYNITDWLGLVPILVCAIFGLMGLLQLVNRKSLKKVDKDIMLLGIYYALVIVLYLLFETIPVNYRPVLINGFAEFSYPSSTTLLVLSVMPTCVFQVNRRFNRGTVKNFINFLTITFSAFMIMGRLVSGVHWLSDIIGSVLLSVGLFSAYKAAVFLSDKNNREV